MGGVGGRDVLDGRKIICLRSRDAIPPPSSTLHRLPHYSPLPTSNAGTALQLGGGGGTTHGGAPPCVEVPPPPPPPPQPTFFDRLSPPTHVVPPPRRGATSPPHHPRPSASLPRASTSAPLQAAPAEIPHSALKRCPPRFPAATTSLPTMSPVTDGAHSTPAAARLGRPVMHSAAAGVAATASPVEVAVAAVVPPGHCYALSRRRRHRCHHCRCCRPPALFLLRSPATGRPLLHRSPPVRQGRKCTQPPRRPPRLSQPPLQPSPAPIHLPVRDRGRPPSHPPPTDSAGRQCTYATAPDVLLPRSSPLPIAVGAPCTCRHPTRQSGYALTRFRCRRGCRRPHRRGPPRTLQPCPYPWTPVSPHPPPPHRAGRPCTQPPTPPPPHDAAKGAITSPPPRPPPPRPNVKARRPHPPRTLRAFAGAPEASRPCRHHHLHP